MCEAFGPFGGLGGSDGLDECLSGGPPPSSGFEDEWDEVLVVLVSCAFGLFSCSGSSGVVVCVGSGVFGALAHSVCYADVDEVVPRVCGADNVHDGAPGLSPGVDVVELGDVLFKVAGVAQVA